MVNIMGGKFCKSYLTVVLSNRVVYSVGSLNDMLVSELVSYFVIVAVLVL